MPDITVFLSVPAEERPPGLPSPPDAVALCHKAGYNQSGFAFPSNEHPIAWIKYGLRVTVGEARTQHMIAAVVNSSPESVVRVPKVYSAFVCDNLCYIVMEYIAGPTADELLRAPGADRGSICQTVAAAVKQLLTLRAPADSIPGPVGRGYIHHPCFYDRRAGVLYPSVEMLEAHFNKLLRINGHPERVSFASEAAEGLILCHGDIHETNFIIADNGLVYAIDFEHLCFLPPAFVAYALQTYRTFTRRVATYIKYPENKNVRAMSLVAGLMVVHGSSSCST
ncbi:kinase-like domain-containing protein [Mycena capillaripes]|nr:kinase-like domain-containing protein [Mycena capillaripes]